jgi:hypothetical protein
VTLATAARKITDGLDQANLALIDADIAMRRATSAISFAIAGLRELDSAKTTIEDRLDRLDAVAREQSAHIARLEAFLLRREDGTE